MPDKKVQEIDLDDILPNRFQPRIKFDEEELTQLANSIKKHGVIQPIIVREIGDKYEIIAGERRYKASVLAGKTTIPVIVNNANDAHSNEIALIENIQRQDLTPIEEAASYKKILEIGNLTQEELAQKIEKKQSTISNKLRLLNLCDEVQEALMNEKISERHARSLLRLREKEKQVAMMNKIIKERLTVRQTDVAIDSALGENTNVDEINIEDVESKKAKPETVTPPTTKESEAPVSDQKEAVFVEDEEPLIKEEENFGEQVSAAESDDEGIADTFKYDYGEYKTSPGFLDIDDIEKNARDINVEDEPKDWEALLKEDEETPHDEITKNLAASGIDVNDNQGDDVPQPEEETQATGRFFNFSPGELIEKEEEKPVPKAPRTPEEITGFDFQYKGAAGTTDVKNYEAIKKRVDEMLAEYKQMGVQTDVEEIDLEDQFQIIIKIKKEED